MMPADLQRELIDRHIEIEAEERRKAAESKDERRAYWHAARLDILVTLALEIDIDDGMDAD